MEGRKIFSIFQPILFCFAFFFKFLPMGVVKFFWSCLNPFNGIIAKGFRYSILKAKSGGIGQNVLIGSNVVLKRLDRFQCGNNVSIHENCYLDCTGGLILGNNVSIAHNSSFITFNHTWSDRSQPIKYNPITTKGIKVEDDVWIACGVRVLDGVVIGSRSVIGAGSVVNKSVKGNSLVGGVPVKYIKEI